MLQIRNIRKVLNVLLADTDYMIKNIADVLDKSKSTPSAVAGALIIRASCPAPITPTVGNGFGTRRF